MGSITRTIKNLFGNPGLDKARKIPPAVPVVTGPFELSINTLSSGNAYIGWSLSSCSIRITNQPQANRNVVLKNRDTSGGGQIIFRSNFGSANQDTLALTLPGDGSPVNFFIGGKFGFPSTDDQDGGISVTDAATSAVLHQRTLMVRVRKNANNLTVGERDRFLNAYATLNAATADYQVFLDSHNTEASGEIHHRPSFLPWHRTFVLSLERHLQTIDPSVTIPYWHFDQPSPKIFSPDFMGGTPNSVGRVSFSATNPLRNWTIFGGPGVTRVPYFDTATSGSQWDGGAGLNPVQDETTTLNLGPGFEEFSDMEIDPHDTAHESFSSGPLTSMGTATQDPLFFLLHCNIDRLWAKWQQKKNKYDPSNNATYSPQPVPPVVPAPRIGDVATDTMWPWNGVKGSPRPPTAPGGPLIQLAFPSKPGLTPTVADVLDYIGKTQGNSNFFDYDDVRLS
jgi:tyrosinase